MQLREMLSAGFGGLAATAVDLAVLVLLVESGAASVPLAAFLAAVAGATVGFAVNKYIAFRDRSRLSLEQLARFGLVAVAAALLVALAMKLVAVELGAPYLAAKASCAVVVFLAWTYPAQRRLVFRRRHPQPWMSLS